MKKFFKRFFITVFCLLLAAAVTVGGIFLAGQLKIQANASRYTLSTEKSVGKDKLHFLNTGASDCIIIESNGHFGMVDCAEDNDYPADKPKVAFKGYEDVVLNYLKKNCRGADGKITLDFVLGTHAHSDHMGGFDTIINDPEVVVKYAYVRKYDASIIRTKEVREWDNQEVYDQMMQALTNKGAEIIQDLADVEFTLGDFRIKLFNGETDTKHKFIGENDNSVICKITKNGMSAVLSGDMNDLTGDESRLAKQIGKVDLLKPGHHGYVASSTPKYVRTLHPEIVVSTNTIKKMYPDVRFNFGVLSDSSVYGTVDENGIIAEFTDDNGIQLYKNIM